MQLTPKPVTAQWRGAADPRSVLRILDYTGTIILRNGKYNWRVIVGPPVRELGYGIADDLMAARVLVEDVIRDHYEGPSVVGVERGTNYIRAEFGDGSSVVMDTSGED